MAQWQKRLWIQTPVFIAVCNLVGLVFTFSALSVRDDRFPALLCQNVIKALWIGLPAFLAGFFVYHRLQPNETSGLYRRSVLASVSAGLFGCILHMIAQRMSAGHWPGSSMDAIGACLTAVMMSFLIATGFILYWSHTDATQTKTADVAPRVLEIKANGQLCFIPADDICYLTAQGKKTIVHTPSEDFTVNMLLKQFLKTFPIPGMMRAHKRHAIQTRALASLCHNHSGEYLARLAGDVFVVPVSPKFLPEIRRVKSS